MSEKTFGLLELGSNSLKFYHIQVEADARHKIETFKIPWRVAHGFYSGEASDEAIAEETIRTLLHVETLVDEPLLCDMWAVATGVFREMSDAVGLARRILEETGIRLRVISGADEARLMARGFQDSGYGPDVVLWDLGGATAEWASFEGGEPADCGSLPLGTIRHRYMFENVRHDVRAILRANAQRCDRELRKITLPDQPTVLATGGTAKAAAAVFGERTIPLAELRKLLARVVRHGAPDILIPARREVFLEGLVILQRLTTCCGADEIEYAKTSVRDGLAHRLVRAMRASESGNDIHATLLLHTQSW